MSVCFGRQVGQGECAIGDKCWEDELEEFRHSRCEGFVVARGQYDSHVRILVFRESSG